MFTKYSVVVECQHIPRISEVPWNILEVFVYASSLKTK